MNREKLPASSPECDASTYYYGVRQALLVHALRLRVVVLSTYHKLERKNATIVASGLDSTRHKRYIHSVEIEKANPDTGKVPGLALIEFAERKLRVVRGHEPWLMLLEVQTPLGGVQTRRPFTAFFVCEKSI